MKKGIERKLREQLEGKGCKVVSLVTHRIPWHSSIDFPNETAADAVTEYSGFEMQSRMKEYEARGISTIHLSDVLFSADNALRRRYFINGIAANPVLADTIRVMNFKRIAEEGRYRLRSKYIGQLAYLINHRATQQST